MKLTDVLAKILKKNSVKQVFGLQGGAVVHIFDSLEKYKIQVRAAQSELNERMDLEQGIYA